MIYQKTIYTQYLYTIHLKEKRKYIKEKRKNFTLSQF